MTGGGCHTLLRLVRQLGAAWQLYCLAIVVSIVEVAAVLAFPLAQRAFVDDILVGGRTNLLVFVVTAMAVLPIAMIAAQTISRHLFTVVSERIALSVRTQLAERVHARPADAGDYGSGDLLAAATTDIETMSDVHRLVIGSGFVALLRLTGTFVVLAFIDLRLLLIGASVVLLYCVVQVIVTPRLRRAGDHVQAGKAHLLGVVQECLTARREIKVFGRVRWAVARQHQAGLALVGAKVRQSKLEVTSLGSAVIYWLTFVGISAFGAHMVAADHLTVGGLLALLYYFGDLESPVTTFITLNNRLQAALAAATRVFRHLDAPAPRTATVTPRPDPVDSAAPRSADRRRSAATVVIDEVTFRHRPESPCLEGISLGAEPGELIAIVGETGSGKSTLVNLVLGLIEPDGGRVLVDGRDPLTVPDEERYDHISVSSGDAMVFDMAVADNIRFGRLDATDDEVRAAAELAGADEFIMNLPHRYETTIGERGSRLSTGQRQRIALARALVGRPGLLLLDEATSGVDAQTEQQVFDRILGQTARPTVVLVTHRLHTLGRADRIYVLHDGRIVEQGLHDTLLRSGRHFYRMCLKQPAAA